MPRRRSRRLGRIVSLLGILILVVGGLVYLAPTPGPGAHHPDPGHGHRPSGRSEAGGGTDLGKDPGRPSQQRHQQVDQRVTLPLIQIWGTWRTGCWSCGRTTISRTFNYRISNVQRLSDTQATADIVWNIQVYDQRTHDYTLVRTAYKTIMEKGSAGWKIRDSKEEGGGPA